MSSSKRLWVSLRQSCTLSISSFFFSFFHYFKYYGIAWVLIALEIAAEKCHETHITTNIYLSHFSLLMLRSKIKTQFVYNKRMLIKASNKLKIEDSNNTKKCQEKSWNYFVYVSVNENVRPALIWNNVAASLRCSGFNYILLGQNRQEAALNQWSQTIIMNRKRWSEIKSWVYDFAHLPTTLVWSLVSTHIHTEPAKTTFSSGLEYFGVKIAAKAKK